MQRGHEIKTETIFYVKQAYPAQHSAGGAQRGINNKLKLNVNMARKSRRRLRNNNKDSDIPTDNNS